MSDGSARDRPRILVVGCGGIGGIVAANLLYQGHDVTPLTRNEQIADAVNAGGFRTRGEMEIGAVPGHAVTTLEGEDQPFDWVLLATQPPQVEQAARDIVERLAPGGRVVVFQNGLCELRVGDIVGPERVIGAIIAWGASMVEPGVYDRTSAGGFVVGRPDGAVDEMVTELARLLEAIGPVTVSHNLMGARWSKLAINCAISSLGTIGGDRLGALLRRRFVRRLTLEVMTEVVLVARAEGVALEKVAGTLDLDWMALTDDERRSTSGSPALVAKHALLLAVGTRYRRLRSSMLNAIERGRAPAVDFLNGEVVERGAEHGIATPINRQLREAVWRIAAGKERPSLELLRALYDRTRDAARDELGARSEPTPPTEPAPEPETAPATEA